MGRQGWVVGIVLLASAVPSAALGRGPRVSVEALTDVPLGVGGAVEGEFPYRIRAGVSALYLPTAYVTLADEVAQAAGGYDDLTSSLIRAATADAFVLRLRLGFRPWPRLGLYIDANYSLLALGGALTGDDLAAAAGISSSSRFLAEWQLSSTVHQIGVEIGYRFRLHDRLWLRVAVGGSFTVDADVIADAVDARNEALTVTIERGGAAYLEDVMKSYVHVPVITVAIAFDVWRYEAE